MKKLLLSALIFSAFTMSAQVGVNENFETYTVGNIGTDLTGATPGQGAWLTTGNNGAAPTTTTNAANSNFSIVDVGGANGKVLQMVGPNGDKGTRLMTQAGLPLFWSTRTAGNNIMEIEFDLFTGTATTSTNAARVLIYDETNTKILSGLSFSMNTKVISGVAYYDNSAAAGGSVGNYLFNLGTLPVVLPTSTWVRVGLSYNYNTGEVRWKGPGFDGFIIGAAPAINPDRALVTVVSGATAAAPNLVAATVHYDGFVLRAVPTGSLLNVNSQPSLAGLVVYPNPVNDVLYFSDAKSLTAVSFTDLNGRIVLSQQLNGEDQTSVDVSKLSSGVYLMTTQSDSASSTKKIIKN